MNRGFIRAISLLTVMVLVASCKPAVTGEPSDLLPETTTPNDTSSLPSSTQLIDAALEKGELDSETALEYKVFAQFSDSRLPEKFKGSSGPAGDSHIVAVLQSQFYSLPAEMQHTLLPFLVPPIYKGSWADSDVRSSATSNQKPGDGGMSAARQLPTPGREGPRTTPFKESLPCNDIDTAKWDNKAAMHSPVRFWWQKDRPGDAAAVERFIVAMDDDIWPKLTGLMGKTPMPDGEVACNGGSADFDIYITPEIVNLGETPAIVPPGCKETPSYILLQPTVSNATLAHEFMHAIQWSYATSADCMYPGEYAWLAEATATWAQDYVYPSDNYEQGYIEYFFADGPSGQTPKLEKYVYGGGHAYAAYLFFFYLTHKFDQPEIVKTAWDNTTSMTSLPAVDKAIPGGFDEVWSEFSVKNVDEPAEDDYQIWDNLNMKPSGTSMSKGKVTTGSYTDAKEIGHLAIAYNWYVFSEDSHLVTFFNGLTYKLDDEPINTQLGINTINDGTKQFKFEKVTSDEIKGVKIQAFYRIAGETDWQLEDWTDKPYISFCRDAMKERLTDLIIVTSNSSQDKDASSTGTYDSLVQVSKTGCYQYGGDASMYFEGEGDVGFFTDEQIIPNVVFERTDEHPNIPYPIIRFKIKEGSLDRTYHIQSEDCSGDGTLSSALSGSLYSFGNEFSILYGAISGPSLNRYSGEANTNEPLTVKFQGCNGAPPQPVQPQNWFAVDILSELDEKVFTVGDDGSLKGTGNILKGLNNATMEYTWNLVSLMESPGSNSSAFEPAVPGDSSGSGSGASAGSGSTEAAPTEAPPKAGLPGVPDYPNTESSKLQSGMLSILTSDSMEVAAKFYREKLASEGWTDITNPKLSTSEMLLLMFAKEPVIITIMIAPLDDKTQIVIRLTG